ncbi:InlB B-repeat-containing protein [Kallotenue papyrolyticum]|uniref:Agd3-related carbohydrate deacetylase n=1 Tax=Kallotenue papyrolyticum TaxID=1325125 RepID=UPI0004786549|nr:hypothetical protein [Kallotenue papyrolyticum]
MLSNGELAYADPERGWISALTEAEWASLEAYTARLQVRRVAWYVYPSPAYGFHWPHTIRDTTASTDATFTEAGAAIFGVSANTDHPLEIRAAYTYLAQAAPDSANVPLLQDTAGNTLALMQRRSDGSEVLALTFDQQANLIHSLQLGYGLVRWALRGLFIGRYQVVLSAQIDDLFLDTALWDPERACSTSIDDPTLPSLRISGADLQRIATWQATQRQTALTERLRLALAYNGIGTTAAYLNEVQPGQPDTLTPVAQTHADAFDWINHTYDHQNLDHATYTETLQQIADNFVVADTLELPASRTALVTPEVSGLDNPAAMRAIADSGIRVVVSDSSKTAAVLAELYPGEERQPQDPPAPNQGRFNALAPSVLMLPRRPNNLFFNVATPEAWVHEYNCLYGANGRVPPPAGWGRDLDYEEILEHESQVLLRYLLRGELYPWMFHQANLHAYDGTRSLFTDLLERTLQHYRRYMRMPISSPSQDQLGADLLQRMALASTPLTATLQIDAQGKQRLEVVADGALSVPITGLALPNAVDDGAGPVGMVSLQPGQPRIFELPPTGAPRELVALELVPDGAGQISLTRATGERITCAARCRDELPINSEVELQASPAAGWRFTGWSGACQGSDATCRLHLERATTLTASFAPAAPPEPTPTPRMIFLPLIGAYHTERQP